MELVDILEKSEADKINTTKYHLYKRRWLILILFYAYSISSITQWIQYSVISDVVVKYYQVPSIAINWSSLISLLITILLTVPASYLIDKFGIRISVLTGIIGITMGSWIKVGSVDPNRYWVYLLGQGIVASFQVLIFPLNAKLAAVWFGAKEVSLACSLVAIATQLGVAIGFIIPPLIVMEGEPQIVEIGLNKMLYSYAVYATILIPILYFWFDDVPPTPPSKAQSYVLQNLKLSVSYIPAVMRVLKCKSFVILSLTCGINIGSAFALSILLNEIVLSHYCDAYEDVGIIGLLMTCGGMLGTFVSGLSITKFGKLREITIAYHVLSLIFTSIFLFMIDFGLPLVYFNGVCLSIFSNGLINIGVELGAELTYPEPEAIPGGLLALIPNIFTIGILYTYSYMFYNISRFSANLFLVALLLTSDLLLVFVKFSLKRQEMEKREKTLDVETYFCLLFVLDSYDLALKKSARYFSW